MFHQAQKGVVYHPTISRSPGSIAGVVARAFNDQGGPKRIAEKLSRNLSTVHAWAHPNGAVRISYEHARELTRLGSSAFAADLAGVSGGSYVPGDVPTDEFHVLAARTALLQASFVAKTVEAMADGKISNEERAALIAELDSSIANMIATRAKLISDGKPAPTPEQEQKK